MLKPIQAASGAVFAVFVALHLVNTWLAAFGPQAYDGVQGVLRTFYQAPPVEALILAALAVHMVVGVMRIVTEPKRTLSTRAKWHRYSGFFLMAFVGGHIFAVRGSSWFFDVYPAFEGLAFSVDYVPAFFYPYYFLLGVAGFYHGFNGLSIALPRLREGLRMRLSMRNLKVGTALATVLMTFALLGFGGWLFDVGDNSDAPFAQLALELIGDLAP